MAQKNRDFAILLPLSGILASLMLAASGCNTKRAPDELARAVNMGERPVAMKGDGTFFDGRVVATVTVSRGIGRGLPPGHKSGESTDHPKILDVTGMQDDEAMAYAKAKYAVGSPMPPVTIHLVLNNLAKDTLSIEVRDFDSDLGNFAVRPAVLSLASGQTAEPEPMISQLGVTSDEIPVTVALKLAGKTESKTILVKNLFTPSADQK